MPETFDYSTPGSENVTLLNALINDETPYTEDTHSRNAEILKSIINNTEYTDAPQSEIEELLLELKEKIGGEVEIDELNVTENGTYSETGKAYSPVNVNVQPVLVTKTITENGTYNASSDDADGYSSVTVAVEGYAKKSIANTPTAIATFNASALPMPSLTVGIEAVQSGTGDPSPTNVRPFTGWSAVNVTKSGVNLWSGGDVSGTTSKVVNIPIRKGTYNISAVVTSSDTDGTQSLISFVDVDGGTTSIRLDRTTRSNSSVTLEKDVIGLRFYAGYNNAQSQGDTFTYADIQLEHSNQATTYEAYNGTTYTTALKDGQGNPMTCYGGTLSNENGVQTLTDAVACDDIGSVSVTYRTDTAKPIFQLKLSKHADETIYSAATNALSSCYKLTTSQNVSQEGYNGCFAISADGTKAYIQDLDYTDATLFKTARAGQKICYKLITPEEIPQDSLSIATQEGTNNLWADSGDIQSGEYLEAL